MTTSGKYSYNQFWRTVDGQTSQVFRVKASRDVNILLSSQMENTDQNTYEITLGKSENTETVIRDGNHLKVGHKFVILYCFHRIVKFPFNLLFRLDTGDYQCWFRPLTLLLLPLKRGGFT